MTIHNTKPETAVNTTHWACKKITEDQMKDARVRRVRAMAKKGKKSVFR